MRLFSLVVPVLTLPLLSADCQGQVQRQTVQLPTFHQFGVSTTVVVPDQGRLYLGGVNRSSLGRGSYRPGVPGLGNRGGGRSMSAGGLSMSATIIDHDEIDRSLLAEAARRRGDRFDIHGRPVTDVPRLPRAASSQLAAIHARAGRNSLEPRHFHATPVGASPVRADSSNSRVGNAELAETYLERGRKAEAKGQPQMAKVFYRRVAKHGNSANKKMAKARLAAIEATSQR